MPNEKRGSKPNGGKRPQRPNQRSRDERARKPERRASGPRPAGRGGAGRSDSGPDRPERPEPAPPTPMDEWIDEGVIPATKEAVRRSVRAAANHSWGKKPVVTVFVTRV